MYRSLLLGMRQLHIWWILLAAGVVVQNLLVFPRHRGILSSRYFRPAGSWSTQQSHGQHYGAVKVSTVLVDVTQEQVDQPVSTVPDSNDADVDCASRPDRQTELGSGLSLREEVVTGMDYCDSWSEGRSLRP